MELRQFDPCELERASELCLRSKAHWGYDAEFMVACREELTLTERDLRDDVVRAAIVAGEMVGVVQVAATPEGCFLEKLFVSPGAMGQGIGKAMFEFAVEVARELGAVSLVVEADPDAVAFYCRMGCTEAGNTASGSIAGRILPRLEYRL